MSEGYPKRENDSRAIFYSTVGLAMTLFGASVIAAVHFLTLSGPAADRIPERTATANAQNDSHESRAR